MNENFTQITGGQKPRDRIWEILGCFAFGTAICVSESGPGGGMRVPGRGILRRRVGFGKGGLVQAELVPVKNTRGADVVLPQVVPPRKLFRQPPTPFAFFQGVHPLKKMDGAPFRNYQLLSGSRKNFIKTQYVKLLKNLPAVPHSEGVARPPCFGPVRAKFSELRNEPVLETSAGRPSGRRQCSHYPEIF